jgi:dihydrofolate synthase/folylpolyglutamate synthase
MGPRMESTTSGKTGLEFLFDRINYERTASMPYRPRALRFERLGRLLSMLGDPHLEVETIHVAGTKGKGSTCHFIESILRSAGYRTGLYTSPHLEHLGERFRVDNQVASSQAIDEQIAEIRPFVEQMDAEGQSLTFFDLTTAIAFHYFRQQRVDYAILEVGLGGRLDSTNICQPFVTAITPISFDHTGTLGTTIPQIAGEKAGVIKNGCPVFVSATDPLAVDVIQETARIHLAPIFRLGHEFRFDEDTTSASLAISTGDREFTQLKLGLRGTHQYGNAALAVAVCDYVGQRAGALADAVSADAVSADAVSADAAGAPSIADSSGVRAISDHAVRTGLAGAHAPARVEVFSTRPLAIVDVAHNEASMEKLIACLADMCPLVEPDADLEIATNGTRSATRRLIFGSSRDKDSDTMLCLAARYFDQVVLVEFQTNPRATKLDALHEIAIRHFPAASIQTAMSPSAAWNKAWAQTTPDDLICVAGSFFLVAELLPAIRHSTAS